jgi:hypothetical protein
LARKIATDAKWPIQSAEPIPVISRSKGATVVKITLSHSKTPKAAVRFIGHKIDKIHLFHWLAAKLITGLSGISLSLQ